MSNAAGAGVRDLGSRSSAKKGGERSDGDEFSRAVSRLAVVQICESVGFQGCQRSALDTFADVVTRYICGVGKAASSYAGSAGRTDCNVFDVIQGLEDLGVAQGFGSASDVQHCPVGSGVIKEIIQYASTSEEEPFSRAIPRYPIVRELNPVPSFAQVGATPEGAHIPDWLPLFPNPHTYIQSPVPAENERVSGIQAAKIEQARQQQQRRRRTAERSLLSLHQRLGWNGAVRPLPSDLGDNGKGKRIATTNPFLAPPLPYGEKEVSEIVIPKEVAATGKSGSITETCALVSEAGKSSSLGQETAEKRVLLNKRPSIHFKLGAGKKSMAMPLSSNMEGVRTDSFFLRDDEKDEKKRRAEIILKEAMGNPEELIQK